MTKVTRLTLDDDGNMKSRRIHLREISGDGDTSLETVGQDLRAARLRRGDDLASVSKVLKIRKDHLESIEEDRIESLPGRTYAIGFVRSYADYLGLDASQCVERFKAEIAGREHADAQQHVTVIDEDEHRRMPQGWKIIAAAVVLLMLYGVYYVISSTGNVLALPVTPSPPPLNPKPAAVQALATPPAATTAAPSAATGTPATPPPLPAGTVYGKQNAGARVVLRVRTPTHVLVEGDTGTVYINRDLQPGDTYQVPNVTGLTLSTPNALAVELDLDGESKGLAGTETGPAQALSLDPQSIADRSGGHG